MIKDTDTGQIQGRNSSDGVYYVKGGGGTGEKALDWAQPGARHGTARHGRSGVELSHAGEQRENWHRGAGGRARVCEIFTL